MWKGSQQMAKVHTTTIIIFTTWEEGKAGRPISTSSCGVASVPSPSLCSVGGKGGVYNIVI